jgi:hypothetical protein
MTTKLFNIPQLPFDVHFVINSFLAYKPWKHIYKNHVTKEDIDETKTLQNAALCKLTNNKFDRSIGNFTVFTLSF